MEDIILTDESQMPYGKYQGIKMEKVPAPYLIWLYENKKCTPLVSQYIESNMETLKLEIKQFYKNVKSWNNYNAK